MNFISHLNSDFVLKHIEQSHELWNVGISVRERFDLQIKRLRDAGPELLFMSGIVSAEGELLASLKRYYFDLKIRDKVCKCVGLGAIFTNVHRRKCGIASELVQKVLIESKNKYQCDFALLFSDIGPRFYERFSFRALPSTNWHVKVEDLKEKIKEVQLLDYRKAESADLDVFVKLYESVSRDFPFKVLRTQKSWKLFREINSIENTYLLSWKERDLGFFSCTPQGEHLWIDEALVEAPHELSLWATLCKVAIDNKQKELRSWNLKEFHPLAVPVSSVIVDRTRAIPMLASLSGVDVTIPDYEKIREIAYIAAPDHL